MKTTKILMGLLILGSAWGVAEIFGDDLLTNFGISGDTSLWLAVWAVLVLSITRGFWNKIGSSSIIALVAALFKYAAVSTNYCQLLGIVSLGLAFDLFASSLLASGTAQRWRVALVGLLTAYGARAFFVLYAIHIAHFTRWVEGGVEMALGHVLGSGSVVAVVSLILAPAGFRIGEKVAAILPRSKAIIDHNPVGAGEH